jgi:Spy/CpxP family protein refolding chaperone
MRTHLIRAALFALLLVDGSSARAQPSVEPGPGESAGPARSGMGPGAGDRGPGGPLLRRPLQVLAAQLELTDEQKTTIAEARARFARDTAEAWREVASIRGEMRELWTSGDVPNKPEVMALQARMRAHRVDIAERSVDARIEILEALTAEQRAQLKSVLRPRSGSPQMGQCGMGPCGRGAAGRQEKGRGPGPGPRSN